MLPYLPCVCLGALSLFPRSRLPANGEPPRCAPAHAPAPAARPAADLALRVPPRHLHGGLPRPLTPPDRPRRPPQPGPATPSLFLDAFPFTSVPCRSVLLHYVSPPKSVRKPSVPVAMQLLFAQISLFAVCVCVCARFHPVVWVLPLPEVAVARGLVVLGEFL